MSTHDYLNLLNIDWIDPILHLQYSQTRRFRFDIAQRHDSHNPQTQEFQVEAPGQA
uniref:Uncharacterized protein n=1 Tax=Arundo donax TaxID=35708 RepID=A0A0A9HEY7_ARUDO